MMPKSKSEIRSYLITSDFIYTQHSAQEWPILLQEFKRYWHETNASREGLKNELERANMQIKVLQTELERAKTNNTIITQKVEVETKKIDKLNGFWGGVIKKIYGIS